MEMSIEMKIEAIECSVCKETLSDPRALPCGHCFCGPPRLCLNSSKTAKGGAIRCAICRNIDRIKPENIPPSCGIRDYLSEECSKLRKVELHIPCQVHPVVECSFWCNECKTMICDECIGNQHDGHAVRNLKKYVVEEIESKLGKPFQEGIADFSENLVSIMDTKRSNLLGLKSKVASVEGEIASLKQLELLMKQYKEVLKSGAPDKSALEISVLVEISKNGSLEGGCIKNSNYTAVQVDKSSGSSTLIKPVLGRVMALAQSSNSIQYESQCQCGGNHQLVAQFTRPLFLISVFPVIQRNPLRLGLSGQLIFCPYQFWIEPTLVHEKMSFEKVLRVIVRSAHAFKLTLPPSTFNYVLYLFNNADVSKCIKYKGVWKFPQIAQLAVDTITYSELMGVENNLISKINGEDFLQIALRLM